MLIDEAGTAPVPALPEYAATVVGRGISLWVAVQDLNQLDHVYGGHRARTLRNNMEQQLFYRQAGLETSEFIERRLGRKSEYAHSKTAHGEHHTSEGEVEQGVSLMTAQEITELADEDIIGIHRNLKPFKARRMGWRAFAHLRERKGLPPPRLPMLHALPGIPPLRTSSLPEFVDPDAMRSVR
jgi:type IV secretory pathway TraG/TraD family ATPase VirD4